MREEVAYPVWSISARWNNESYQNNSTSFVVSFRRNFSDASMNRWAARWFRSMVARKYPGEQIEPIEIKVTSMGKRVWFLNWFCHKSLNRFDTEEQAFESFDRYLIGIGRLDDGYHVTDLEGRTLMGADDRWRWKYCDKRCCASRNQTIITH